MVQDWASDPLWRRLRAMRIGPLDAALTFEKRLARENGWSDVQAAEVMEEYRRFLYLAAVVREPITPSVAVDQAWHLHLTYSRHYRDVLCDKILGRPFHHEPTHGGSGESARFWRQYERTLAAYSSVFGSEPPPAIWPDAQTRFAARLCCVDRAEVWVVGKASLSLTGMALAIASTLSACAALDEKVGDWLPTIIVFALLMTAVGWANRKLQRRGRQTGGEIDMPDLDSGCGGGCGGCGG